MIMPKFWNKLQRALGEDIPDEPVPEPEAVVTLRRTAEQGDAEAQARLGDMYYNGEDVAQDYAAAAEWYLRAAGQGNATAQFHLGNMYRVGLGVHQDQAEASQWLTRAAAQGDAAAQALLDKLDIQAKVVSRDFIEAVKRLQNAAEQGEAGAQLLLGSMCETGNGLTCDLVMALVWVELALETLPPGPMRAAGRRQQSRLAANLLSEAQARARQLAAERRAKTQC